MTDRDLIEAAAKSAGLDLGHWDEDLNVWVYPFRSDLTNCHHWNPLTDDGDALRLAVKLQLTVCNEHVSAGAVVCTLGDDFVGPEVRSGTPADAEVTDADYVATRRAVVLAAAAIGKAMP